MSEGPSKRRGRPAANDSFHILLHITPDVNRGVPILEVTKRPLRFVRCEPGPSQEDQGTLVVHRQISGPTLARRAREVVGRLREEQTRHSELAAREGTRWIGISPPRPPLFLTPTVAKPGRPKKIRKRSI